MAIIGNWGNNSILDKELKAFSISYGFRLARLTTVYDNPYLQLVGKKAKQIKLTLQVSDEDKIYAIWNERQSLNASIRNCTMFTINHGDWYLTNTEIEWLSNNYIVDEIGNRVVSSTFMLANIKLEGLQE